MSLHKFAFLDRKLHFGNSHSKSDSHTVQNAWSRFTAFPSWASISNLVLHKYTTRACSAHMGVLPNPKQHTHHQSVRVQVISEFMELIREVHPPLRVLVLLLCTPEYCSRRVYIECAASLQVQVDHICLCHKDQRCVYSLKMKKRTCSYRRNPRRHDFVVASVHVLRGVNNVVFSPVTACTSLNTLTH